MRSYNIAEKNERDNLHDHINQLKEILKRISSG